MLLPVAAFVRTRLTIERAKNNLAINDEKQTDGVVDAILISVPGLRDALNRLRHSKTR